MRSFVLLLGLVGCDRLFNLDPVSATGTDDGGGGDTLETDAPVPTIPTRLTAGSIHTCAASEAGTLRCWGAGANGRTGAGNSLLIGDDEVPSSRPVVEIGGTVMQVAAGGTHTCVLLDTGAVRCFGLGNSGQLGYGNMLSVGETGAPSGAGDVALGGAATQVSTGDVHTCAVTNAGGVLCWGFGMNGRLGYNSISQVGDIDTPAAAGLVALGGVQVTQVSAGGSHTCVVTATNGVRCWGAGANGRLGYAATADIGDNEDPSINDVMVGSMVRQVAAGGAHTCALLTTGAVRCWGLGTAGALGYGDTNSIGDGDVPSDAGDVALGNTATQVVTGGDHTCALLSDRTVRCWGLNDLGQLGYGNINSLLAPGGPVSLGGDAIQISAGRVHTCALLDGGIVRCWGQGFDGRLGYGNTEQVGNDEVPSSVPPVSVF